MVTRGNLYIQYFEATIAAHAGHLPIAVQHIARIFDPCSIGRNVRPSCSGKWAMLTHYLVTILRSLPVVRSCPAVPRLAVQ